MAKRHILTADAVPSAVEQQIRKAEREGAFRDLPGHGKPLASTRDAHDPAWWAKQLVVREGISVLPPALELRREVERLKEALPELKSERELRERIAVLNDRIRRINSRATSGPPTSVAPLDEEALVAAWRSS